MDLFKPAWKSDDLQKALRGVDKARGDAKLYEIVEGAVLPEVRRAAVSRLSDQELLYTIAMNDGYREEIRVEAVKRIDSQDLLFKLATTARVCSSLTGASADATRRSAVTGVPDHDWCVRAAAISRVDSDARLAAIAQDPNDDTGGAVRYSKQYGGVLGKMRGLAVKRIGDAQILRDLALHSREFAVRTEAVWRLCKLGAGKDVLEDIARNAEHWDAREAAMFALHGFGTTLHADELVAAMDDQDMLYDFACNSPSGGSPTWAAEKAVRKLKDPARLRALFDYKHPTKPAGYLRGEAENRLRQLLGEN